MRRNHVPVLIAGAGPVGMAVAAELGLRGICCRLVDKGSEYNDHPRANVISPRTMEHFRRWGIDEDVTAAGLPVESNTDVIFTTRMLSHEITRFRFPSVAAVRQRSPELLARYPEIAHSPYLKTAVGQNFLEPVLRRFVRSLPSVRLDLGHAVTGIEQTHHGVMARVLDDAGHETKATADYLIACDGARSTVRELLGVEMTGRSSLGENVGIYFRSPALLEACGKGPGILYWTLAPSCTGVFIAIDGRQLWVMQRHLHAHESLEHFDGEGAVRAAVGGEVPFDIISVRPWVARQLVANSYRFGRIFLAGDAAHLVSPTGGFGMNTGIGDAIDLGWKLAAVLEGWAPEALLDSYDAERRPTAWRNALEATDNRVALDASSLPPEAIDHDTPEGAALRAQWAERIARQRKHFAAVGIHLGYRYEGSPIIITDGMAPPPDEPDRYVPSARPGSRAPHVWMADGRSLLDHFGGGFTLLRFHADADAEPLLAEASRRRVPMRLVDVQDSHAAALYERDLVLVRPDGHVAWRGDACESPHRMLDIICGAKAAANERQREDNSSCAW